MFLTNVFTKKLILRFRCHFAVNFRNLTRSLRSLVRYLIRQQLVRIYRTPALSMKYSLYIFFRVQRLFEGGVLTTIDLIYDTRLLYWRLIMD